MDPSQKSQRIHLIPHTPSVFNFQKCTIGYNVLRELEESSCETGFFEGHLSIERPSRQVSLLLKCCKSSVGDVANAIQLDLRVEQLHMISGSGMGAGGGITSIKEFGESEATLSCESSNSTSGAGEPHVSSAEYDDDDDAYDDGKSKCRKMRREIDLGRHLLAKMNEDELNSCRDLDEYGGESSWSMRFNDALWCTSKDIQMLKSGTIKMMRLTVISEAPLSDFLYQAKNQHQQQHDDEEKRKKTADSKNSFGQTTTSKKSKETGGTSSHSSWKLLREKIHQVFHSYDIHVKSDTLVDLRKCPLSAKGKFGCPSVSFVFVEECLMRNSESDGMVGRVATKTEILINHVHHVSHYKRLVYAFGGAAEEESDSGEKLPPSSVSSLSSCGLENASKALTSLIEMQVRMSRGEDFILRKHCGDTLDNFYSHGLLIVGPSGCGKALAVRETVKKLRAALVVFDSAPVVSSSGQDFSSYCETWTEIFTSSIESAKLAPTVLLIPKINESLLIKRNKSSKTFVPRLVNHVCNLFDSIPKNAMLTVVATTDKAYLLPPKMRRAGRLEREVYMGAPTEEQRFSILKSLSKKVPSLAKLDMDSVAKRTPGYVGQDLIRVAHLAILKSYEENCSQVSDDHIKYALARILPSVLQGTLGVVGIQRNASLDHIAGLHSVKLDLIKAIVWPLKYPHAFRRMGITPPKGILLHSPPGCAKTTLVRAVAASHQTNFLSVSAAELFSSGVGDSEKIVADLFHRARMASPCILFIDELEAIVGSRQMSQKREKSTNESILSMFLTEMDGVGTRSHCLSDKSEPDSEPIGPTVTVLVVAATNRIDMIDSALIRPGRFDKLIYVPPLDKDGRLELLRICSKTAPISPDTDLEMVAAETEGYTGADLVNMIREAAMFALTEDMNSTIVSESHFNKAKKLLSCRVGKKTVLIE